MMSKKQILISESEKKSILLQHVSKGYKTIIMEGNSMFTVTVAIKTDLSNELIQGLKDSLELEFYICDSGNCKRKGFIKCNETKTFSAEKKILFATVSAEVNVSLDCEDENNILKINVVGNKTELSQAKDMVILSKFTDASAEEIRSMGLLVDGSNAKDYEIKLTIGEVLNSPTLPDILLSRSGGSVTQQDQQRQEPQQEPQNKEERGKRGIPCDRFIDMVAYKGINGDNPSDNSLLNRKKWKELFGVNMEDVDNNELKSALEQLKKDSDNGIKKSYSFSDLKIPFNIISNNFKLKEDSCCIMIKNGNIANYDYNKTDVENDDSPNEVLDNYGVYVLIQGGNENIQKVDCNED